MLVATKKFNNIFVSTQKKTLISITTKKRVKFHFNTPIIKLKIEEFKIFVESMYSIFFK